VFLGAVHGGADVLEGVHLRLMLHAKHQQREENAEQGAVTQRVRNGCNPTSYLDPVYPLESAVRSTRPAAHPANGERNLTQRAVRR